MNRTHKISKFFLFLFLLPCLSGGFLAGCHQIRPPSILSRLSAQELTSLRKPVFFGFNQSALEGDGKAGEQRRLLNEKAKILARYQKLRVVLEGHTDRIGSVDYNLRLGDRRARWIKWFLAEKGVEPDRLVVVSLGKSKPRRPDQSASARRENRRVEFVLP